MPPPRFLIRSAIATACRVIMVTDRPPTATMKRIASTGATRILCQIVMTALASPGHGPGGLFPYDGLLELHGAFAPGQPHQVGDIEDQGNGAVAHDGGAGEARHLAEIGLQALHHHLL